MTATTLTLVVMGVTGSGKTTVGQRLAERLGCLFLDADDFHPPENVEKMASGVPLDDNDRWPWLDAVRSAVDLGHQTNPCVVVACSALKSSYRDELRRAKSDVRFVFLSVDPEDVRQRVTDRTNHFMPATLVKSQFEALEEPADALVVDAGQPVEDVVADIIGLLAD